MEIQSVGMNYSVRTQPRNAAKAENQAQEAEKLEPRDSYESGNHQAKATYDKPKVDHTAIARLKEESERVYQSLKETVEQLLRSQGKTFQDFLAGEAGEIEVDEETRLNAQAAISEGGEYSAEKVSDRLVEFAIAISGDDTSKFEMLKSAIDEGFKQAAAALGGQLPEISQRTYELTMEKLSKWKEDA